MASQLLNGVPTDFTNAEINQFQQDKFIDLVLKDFPTAKFSHSPTNTLSIIHEDFYAEAFIGNGYWYIRAWTDDSKMDFEDEGSPFCSEAESAYDSLQDILSQLFIS